MDKTFTKEQFDEAVNKALNECHDVISNNGDSAEDVVTTLLIDAQNRAFASLLGLHLFGEEPIKEDTTIN